MRDVVETVGSWTNARVGVADDELAHRASSPRLQVAKVAVIGAGGLGNLVAGLLAAAGLSRLTLIDRGLVQRCGGADPFDDVDLGLAKAEVTSGRLANIYPGTTFTPLVRRLAPVNAVRLLGGHDIVVTCTADLECRLTAHEAAQALVRPMVWGLVRSYDGQVGTWVPGRASYRETFVPGPVVPWAPESNGNVRHAVLRAVAEQMATAVEALAGIDETAAASHRRPVSMPVRLPISSPPPAQSPPTPAAPARPRRLQLA